MCCLFVPPDWSVCHPVASSTCLQVQALLALCHLHVLPVWPSRLVSLSSSSLFHLPTGAGPTCSACLTGQLSPGCSQHSVQHSCSVQLGCQAWCSKDACTVQRFRYMQHERLCCPACLLYAYIQHESLLCMPGVGNTHTYTCNSQSGSSSVRTVRIQCNSRSCSRSIHTSHNDLSLQASYQSYVRASLHSTVLNTV